MNPKVTHLIYSAGTFLLLALNPPVFAEEVQLNSEFSRCMDQSDGVTANMLDCIGQENERQDAQLNRVYQALMTSLSENRKTALRDAQRAWLKYRDANCDFYYDSEGGSMARIEANDCLMTETANRVKELEDIRSMLQNF